MKIFTKRFLVPGIAFIVCLVFFNLNVSGQIAVRYQSDIKGGVTLFGNSWFYSTPSGSTTLLTADVDGDATTTFSNTADLILPAGSTIIKAYLSIEKGVDGVAFTSVKIKVPGGAYQTLSTSGPLSLANRITQSTYNQSVFDITSVMPPAGYVSVAGGGAAGRYTLADPTPFPSAMGGWSIIVVYSNPASKYRNVTVADGWQEFYSSSASIDVPGVKVPSSGSITAVVGVTSTYGDRGLSDFVSFGQTSGTMTNLADPTTGFTNDAGNSSIGKTAVNNVSADGGPAMSGNVTTRNPISGGHYYGVSESWEYDADVFNASGILPNSTTPISATLTQTSTSNDKIESGSYFISINLAAPILTKSVAPATIASGSAATYTFTVNNAIAGNIAQTGISFTDLLPAGLKIAATPNVVVTGLTGGTTTATAGGNSITASGYSIAANTTATITVNVTNVPGQLNASCAANPAAFTNTAANISGISANLDNQIGNVCLVVTCSAGITAPVPAATNISNTCPATTANLTTLQQGIPPTGSQFQWHTGTPGTAANIYSTPTTAAAGTYYLTYYDVANGCFSPTSAAVTVTITACPPPCGANAGVIIKN